MTSTNDGKEVKSNQTSGHKGKSYYIDLYKSLEKHLSEECELRVRTQHLCSAWRRVHTLCQHSAPTTHPHYLAWLQRHTANTLLQSEWQSEKDEHKKLHDAIESFIAESKAAVAARNGSSPAWESQLVQRGEWFKRILGNPWGHPVLKLLCDPRGEQPSDKDILEWLKEERGVMFVTRLRHLAASRKCHEIALALSSAVMHRVRASETVIPDAEQADDQETTHSEGSQSTFKEILRLEAGFTVDVWEILTDLELVLLHKRDEHAQCIALAKRIPLRSGYQLVERLRSRPETSPREKKIWKNAGDVATLVAQVLITRCMVVPRCQGAARGALYCCARALARLLGARRLPAAAAALAAPAATARHLHTLAQALHAQLHAQNIEDMNSFVCELYVRAITAGMNELEKLKLKTEKEAEARSMEQTLATWFTSLGSVLSCSNRIQCECALTAFSVHPSALMYEKIKMAPPLPIIAEKNDPKEETKSEFGSWANDSRSQTNLVKTSETLNLKQIQQHTNVMSTAIFAEGEAIGLSAELCQDLTVCLSGPRVKTLSWDMDREVLLENCRTYMERTHSGTRALTTELKYLNLDPSDYQHLPEEEDDENDVYYGIEKGYEHLVELQEEAAWQDPIFDHEATETAYSSCDELFDITTVKHKKKKRIPLASDNEMDPLSAEPETDKGDKKKERPHSKERSKEKTKKSKDPEEKEKRKEKKKERKKEKAAKSGSLASLIGVKVSTELGLPAVSDSDYDSQGKSSLASEGNDPSIIFDGLFSMDDPLSDKPFMNTELGVANGHIAINKALKKAPTVSKKKPTTTTKSSTNTSTSETKPLHNVKSVSSLLNVNTKSPRPSAVGVVSEQVKRSITKLLQFRRKQNSMLANKNIHSNTPKVEHKPLNAIYKPEFPTQPFISPKSVVVPEIPKSYINKASVERLEVERSPPMLPNNTIITETMDHNSKRFNSNSQQILSTQSPNRSSIEAAPSPSFINSDLSVNEYKDILHVPNYYQNLKPNSPNILSTKKCSKQPPHNNSISLTRGVTPKPQEDPKNLEDYSRDIKPTSSPFTGVIVKKDFRMTSRVSPALQNLPNTDITTSLQCAKQTPQKRVENAPNTFSRLSYLKNKQALETQSRQEDLSKQMRTPMELSRCVSEFKNTQIKYMQTKGETVITRLDNPLNLSCDNVNVIRKAETFPSTSNSHTVIKNMFQPTNILQTPVSKNDNVQGTSTTIATVPPKTYLSEKDQNDLLLLLRQQNRINSAVNVTQSAIPAYNTQTPNSTSATDSNTSNKTASTNVLSKSKQGISVINNNLQQYALGSKESKHLGSKVNIYKNSTNESGKSRIIKKSGIERNYSSKSSIKESDKLDWQKVMNAIRAQKTPSRGPTALELTLKGSEPSDNSLRNQRIMRTSSVGGLDQVTKTADSIIKHSSNVKPQKTKDTFLQPSSNDVGSAKQTIDSKSLMKGSELDSLNKSMEYKKITKNVCSNRPATEVDRKPVALDKNQFAASIPKQKDPFISGRDDDYNLSDLDDLLDDELRRELGELSSDEDTYRVPQTPKEIKIRPCSKISNTSYKQDESIVNSQKIKSHFPNTSCISNDLRQSDETTLSNSSYSKSKDCSQIYKTKMKPSQQSLLSQSKVFCNENIIRKNKPLSESTDLSPHCSNMMMSSNASINKNTTKHTDPSLQIEYNTTQRDTSNTVTSNNTTISPCLREQYPDVAKSSKTAYLIENTRNIYVTVPRPTPNIVLLGPEIYYNPIGTIQNKPDGVNQNYVKQNNILMTPFPQPACCSVPVSAYDINTLTVTTPTVLDNDRTALNKSNLTAYCQQDQCLPTESVKYDQMNIKTECTKSINKSEQSLQEDDINYNKNSERRVLLEVQENNGVCNTSSKLIKNNSNPTIEIAREILYDQEIAVDNALAKSVEKSERGEKFESSITNDIERLKRKRLAILNRSIIQSSINPPIALSYSPIFKKVSPIDVCHKKSEKSMDTRKVINVIAQEIIKPPSSKSDDCNKESNDENSKENDGCTVQCRRILLRSSNKNIPKVPLDFTDQNPIGRKTKVRLKAPVRNITNEDSSIEVKPGDCLNINIVNEDAEIPSKHNQSKKIKRKTVRKSKVNVDNDTKDHCESAIIPINSNSFDIEDALLGSMIPNKKLVKPESELVTTASVANEKSEISRNKSSKVVILQNKKVTLKRKRKIPKVMVTDNDQDYNKIAAENIAVINNSLSGIRLDNHRSSVEKLPIEKEIQKIRMKGFHIENNCLDKIIIAKKGQTFISNVQPILNNDNTKKERSKGFIDNVTKTQPLEWDNSVDAIKITSSSKNIYVPTDKIINVLTRMASKKTTEQKRSQEDDKNIESRKGNCFHNVFESPPIISDNLLPVIDDGSQIIKECHEKFTKTDRLENKQKNDNYSKNTILSSNIIHNISTPTKANKEVNQVRQSQDTVPEVENIGSFKNIFENSSILTADRVYSVPIEFESRVECHEKISTVNLEDNDENKSALLLSDSTEQNKMIDFGSEEATTKPTLSSSIVTPNISNDKISNKMLCKTMNQDEQNQNVSKNVKIQRDIFENCTVKISNQIFDVPFESDKNLQGIHNDTRTVQISTENNEVPLCAPAEIKKKVSNLSLPSMASKKVAGGSKILHEKTRLPPKDNASSELSSSDSAKFNIPQSYKDSIIIEEIPNDRTGVNVTTLLRIKLPNGKIFKASVYGKMHSSFDSLFEDPSLRAMLMSDFKEQKKYTLNIKQVSKTNKENPDKPLESRIQEIQVESKSIKPAIIETIDLLSDDEDHDDNFFFTTKSGVYKTSIKDKAILDKHQEKLNQNCCVRLERLVLPETNVNEEVDIIEIDDYCKSFNQESCPAIDLNIDTASIVDVQNMLSDIPPVQNKITENSQDSCSDLIEIDESSNDSVDLLKNCPDFPIDFIAGVSSVSDFDEKLEVANFDTVDICSMINKTAEIICNEKEINILDGSINIAKSTSSIDKIEKFANANIGEVEINLEMKKPGDLVHKQNDVEATFNSTCDDSIEKDQCERILLKSLNCYVRLTRCDDLVENYNRLNILNRSCSVSLERCDSIVKSLKCLQEEIGAMEYCDKSMKTDVSSIATASILNDFSILPENQYKEKIENGRNSPVIEVFEIIASLCKNYKYNLAMETMPLKLECDWLLTKRQMHHQHEVIDTNYMKNTQDIDISLKKINAGVIAIPPSLFSLLCVFFQKNNNILQYLKPLEKYNSDINKNNFSELNLKRKMSNLADHMIASKISKNTHKKKLTVTENKKNHEDPHFVLSVNLLPCQSKDNKTQVNVDDNVMGKQTKLYNGVSITNSEIKNLQQNEAKDSEMNITDNFTGEDVCAILDYYQGGSAHHAIMINNETGNTNDSVNKGLCAIMECYMANEVTDITNLQNSANISEITSNQDCDAKAESTERELAIVNNITSNDRINNLKLNTEVKFKTENDKSLEKFTEVEKMSMVKISTPNQQLENMCIDRLLNENIATSDNNINDAKPQWDKELTAKVDNVQGDISEKFNDKSDLVQPHDQCILLVKANEDQRVQINEAGVLKEIDELSGGKTTTIEVEQNSFVDVKVNLEKSFNPQYHQVNTKNKCKNALNVEETNIACIECNEDIDSKKNQEEDIINNITDSNDAAQDCSSEILKINNELFKHTVQVEKLLESIPENVNALSLQKYKKSKESKVPREEVKNSNVAEVLSQDIYEKSKAESLDMVHKHSHIQQLSILSKKENDFAYGSTNKFDDVTVMEYFQGVLNMNKPECSTNINSNVDDKSKTINVVEGEIIESRENQAIDQMGNEILLDLDKNFEKDGSISLDITCNDYENNDSTRELIQGIKDKTSNETEQIHSAKHSNNSITQKGVPDDKFNNLNENITKQFKAPIQNKLGEVDKTPNAAKDEKVVNENVNNNNEISETVIENKEIDNENVETVNDKSDTVLDNTKTNIENIETDNKNVDQDKCLLKGIEFEDPDVGILYVLYPIDDSESETATFNDSSDDITDAIEAIEGSDENVTGICSNKDDDLEVLNVNIPKMTYSKQSEYDLKLKSTLKRKISFTDPKFTTKRYRNGKNIDYPKITAAAILEQGYAKEYKRVLNYSSSLKFSYNQPFHKDYVDTNDSIKNWPIQGPCVSHPELSSESHCNLFTDVEMNPNYEPEALKLTLEEEINQNYNVVNEPSSDIKETNFNMGFGEGSGRVIQNLEDVGDISKVSAATLSDVKQPQPFLLSEDCEDNRNTKNAAIDDQIEKIQRYLTYIKLRENVKSFFQKNSIELIYSRTNKKEQDVPFNKKLDSSNFPFDLYIQDFIDPCPVEAIVQVVQVGQLPVSAAAQNPVTCDPRVTQVSDASPSQCSAENSPHDDSSTPIKTEYTELTTADLTLPLVQEYIQHDQTISMESHQSQNISMPDENIPIETEIKSVVKIELMEELPEEKEELSEPLENTDIQSMEVNHSNNEYSFETNNSENTYETNTAMATEFEPNNTKASDEANMQILFNCSEKPTPEDNFPEQKQQNGSQEKTDQIAHAMSAAGITTTAETIANNRAQALVNILSQKMRQGAVGGNTTTSNSYPKTTAINAMALQQALAQILPPPLNQTNVNDNSQASNTQVAPQVLHIVQGKNASGSQITLVDNSQQSVISGTNATPVLHIVQNKAGTPGATNGTPGTQTNSFSGLSLVDTGLQQGGNQLLHIVNTGSQKNNSAGQLLKRVNLLTNLANVQGSNEQKMVQFVCKSADGKSIQLNAPHQRSMVLRLQPIESPVPAAQTKPAENKELNQSPSATTASNKDSAASQQEIKSRSIYEENYAKFIQNSSTKPSAAAEKSTSLPKFNQAFGKPVFQDGTQKSGEISSNNMTSVNTPSENNECQPTDNSINLEHISQMNSPPLLIRKSSAQTSQAQTNLVQQIKQTIAPMNIQTMHGGVIYTRQIPVNIGGGQTINLITVPSTELIDESGQKQVNQGEIEPSIIKIVPQSQPTNNSELAAEDNGNNLGATNENNQNPQPQPVLTQMRIKLPMLSKTPQMVSGARVVRPSFFQIQRNVIGGANQPVYQQLVLTAAPPLGQQTIRLPTAQATRPQLKVPSESQSTESMSSSTLEQLREFDMVLEQVKERSTVQPNSNATNTFPKLHTPTSDTTDSATSAAATPAEPTQVLYSIGNNQSLNVAYVNRKTTVATTPTTSSFVRSPDSSGIADSPTSSTHVQLPHTVTSESTSSETPSQPKPAKIGSKSKSRPKSSSNPPNTMKINPVPPKTSTQKPLEDEQTTQRILYILAEYKEQVENSPDKDKPAPRRRSNPPSNPSGSSKRKKSSSGSRRPGGRDMSPVHGDDTCRTMGSEDSSCGTSQGDCNESCLDSHSPQDSPRKIVRKLTFEQENPIQQPRPQPQRNVIVADGQTITVARGTAGKPATAVLMPANYILPVSMVKGGQQIAIVTNRGPKLLTVGGGEGGTTNALLLQRLIGPAGLKPVLARPGVRHVRLPTAALHNLQAFNLATAATVQPPDSTASPAPAPTPPELIETRAASSPWTDRESQDVKPERGSSPEGSEPWNLPSSADPHDYTYEETVRADNMDRTVLVVQKKDGTSQRHHRLTHVSAAALRHKYAILEHELRLQKSLSEECEDLGVDSPSASELFPEAELLFAASPAHDHTQDQGQQSHTPQPTHMNQSSIPQPDIDDQIATDQLLPREDMERQQLELGLDDVGIVSVNSHGMQTIALDHEEFARAHPNTTFHSEPTDDAPVQPFTIAGLKGRHITSTIFHSNRAPATVLMTAPQTTVISQAAAEPAAQHVKYDIDNMINSLPSSHNNINLSSVLVKDDGLTRFDNILNDSRELHLTNTASAIVHSTGNATQVIRRVCYDDKRDRDSSFLMDEPDALIAGDDAKMIAEDSSRDATLESMADVDDDRSSPERHTELFWESNSASERSESRRPLDFSSDSDKCCKSPSYDETNSTDSSGVGTHMRLDSVIKDARGIERSGSADGSSADDTHPPLRTYPPKRMYHPLEGEMERSLSGKTRAGERSPDSLEVRRRASGRGVVKRGCHCCNGSPAPPRPKKSRQRKPTMDFHTN
ncbi:uncharacterized protein LOC106135241 [Amyelois transitella]|uniref:uncharacterized protein LOC106135241 n=1 Tax=Amyelois transitella TaxID=680683 RepID=UPI00067E3F92|nr:uncharacterized protein LOC106135241 [Amyelois transitella]